MENATDKTQNELIEKYTKMTEEELKEHLSKGDMKKYDRLNYSFVRVHMLLDFMNVIDNHKSELQSPQSKVIVKSGKNISPSQTLYEYIILEITSFYIMVQSIKRKEHISLPDLPPYWKKIISFRDEITAHLDKDGRLKTIKEWMEKYEEVDKIGIKNIITDFESDYKKCRQILQGQI